MTSLTSTNEKLGPLLPRIQEQGQHRCTSSTRELSGNRKLLRAKNELGWKISFSFISHSVILSLVETEKAFQIKNPELLQVHNSGVINSLWSWQRRPFTLSGLPSNWCCILSKVNSSNIQLPCCCDFANCLGGQHNVHGAVEAPTPKVFANRILFLSLYPMALPSTCGHLLPKRGTTKSSKVRWRFVRGGSWSTTTLSFRLG